MKLNISTPDLEEMERAIKQRIIEALNNIPVGVTFKDIPQLSATIEIHNAVKELVSQRDDLLGACKELLQSADSTGCSSDLIVVESSAVEAIRAAIARAEGNPVTR
jgi:hypothetical protein